MSELGAIPKAVHAACVAWRGRGLLILGASGAGKSRLTLELIALGCALVADDRVRLRRAGAALVAEPEPALAGLIEARGIGLLRLPHRARAAVALALDLDRCETSRLPPARLLRLHGADLPLIFRPEPLSPASVLATLRHGPPLDADRE